MTESIDPIGRAPYYDGRGFPLEALSPNEFEDFVFGSLLCIEDVLGLRITGKPSGSGDGGFDVQGKVIGSGRIVCVQCKRQKQPLDISQITKELAKVAATAVLEDSDIGEHRFICTGGVRTKLIRQLREQPRSQLATEVGKRLITALDDELSSLRMRLEEIGENPRQVAESYVLGLDLLIAWDAREFDAALSPRWGDVLQVAERYFRIATVVREYPRASFDRVAYIAEHANFKVVVTPRLIEVPLPESFTAVSAAQPAGVETVSQKEIKTLQDLSKLETGELAVLMGDGGAGKSTALALLRSELLRLEADSSLPILISLTNYIPGSLDRFIHQELRVEHGTWRSLPDRILLLCDGLNECSSANAAAFFDELKYLLKRRQAACVISTRESTRHRNILLPQTPVSCIKVGSLTPIAIRRIAEHEINDGTSEEFLKAYRLLSDKSGSPHLWTPFSVLVAIRLWKLNTALPPTLGEMLEIIQKYRCMRDAELPGQYLSPAVILQLASTLAFQSIFIEKRLECPALEAGKWIREAKKRCADALGVADMTEKEIVDLLTHHEILHLSASGHLSFGHQLLAGALGASILASVWEEYTECIGDSIADDAWVFAARLIPREHLTKFLTAMFQADLMLGVRATLELPKEFHQLGEEFLNQSIHPESSEVVRIQGLYSLARLGSPGAMAKLREMSGDTRSPIQYAAQRARAASGDFEYLKKLLPRVEKMIEPPVQVSGGDVGIWEVAPLAMRLDLARHRLYECTPGEPVKESLSLLAYERDANDAEIIEKHLRAASELSAFQVGLYALHQVSPDRAKEFFEETLVETTDPSRRATAFRIAALIGIKIDMKMAFECALMDFPFEESNTQAIFNLERLITEVLVKSTLPSTLVAVIEDELPRSVGNRRDRLWLIARCCESSVIAEYAASCIDEWGIDVGHACNYFIDQRELAHARRPQLLAFCENGLKSEKTWYTWEAGRVLALVGMLGFTSQVADYLSAMVRRLTRVHHAVEISDISSLSFADAEVLKSVKSEHARTHLGMLVAQLIPAIVQAKAFLPEDVLLSFLYFDTHSSDMHKHQSEMLSGVSDEAIDDILCKIKEPWTILSSLMTACTRGSTKIRLDLLENELRKRYSHPAALNILCRAVDACWCPIVCQMVVKTVAGIPTWSEYDSQFFWDFTRMVAKHVGPDDLNAIEKALLEAKTPFAKRILKMWHDHAVGTRIGLARIFNGEVSS